MSNRPTTMRELAHALDGAFVAGLCGRLAEVAQLSSTPQRLAPGRDRGFLSGRLHHELYLALEDIDHTRTKARHPQTNGTVERFHKTMLDEFYRIAFRKTIYTSTDQLQRDLDTWISEYNLERPHQGRWRYGKTPMQTFKDSVELDKRKAGCMH